MQWLTGGNMSWWNWYFGTPTADPTPPADQQFSGVQDTTQILLIPQAFTIKATKPDLWMDGMVNVTDGGDLAVEGWGSRTSGGNEAANRFIQLTASAKPTWSATNGYLSFDGGDRLVSGTDNFLSGSAGRLMVVASTVQGAANQVAFCVTDATAAATYLAAGVSGPGNRIWMGLKNEGVDDYELSGNTILSEGIHLLEWWWNGNYGGLVVDGLEQSLSVTGSNAGKSFADISSNGACIGALVTSAGASLNWGGSIYEIVGWNVDKRSGVLTRLRNKLASKYSITLA